MSTVSALSSFLCPPSALRDVCELLQPALRSEVRARAAARGLRVSESSWRAAASRQGTAARLLVLADCAPCDSRSEAA